MAEYSIKRRVFLVDDHPLVREGLTTLINQQDDLTVCGEAEDAAGALQAIQQLRPDAAVIDITLSGGSGIELTKDVKRCCPRVAIIVLSMHDDFLYAERALRAGAGGYVMKRETTKNVVAALRKALEGGLYISERIAELMTKKAITGHNGTEGCPVMRLSDRELSVFEMLGRGVETKRIAESLCISPKTVQVYYARIKEKLNAQNLNEVLCEAVRWLESKR